MNYMTVPAKIFFHPTTISLTVDVNIEYPKIDLNSLSASNSELFY